MKGKLYINGKDAYQEFGLVFSTESVGLNENYSALLTPPAIKSYTTVDFREREGEEVSIKTPRYQARDITLFFAIVANDETDWWEKYKKFTDELKVGWIDMEVVQLEKNYRLVYQSFGSYKQLTDVKQPGKIAAKFQVKFREPKPSF